MLSTVERSNNVNIEHVQELQGKIKLFIKMLKISDIKN